MAALHHRLNQPENHLLDFSLAVPAPAHVALKPRQHMIAFALAIEFALRKTFEAFELDSRPRTCQPARPSVPATKSPSTALGQAVAARDQARRVSGHRPEGRLNARKAKLASVLAKPAPDLREPASSWM
jgi:hypothetical protein